MYIFNILYLLFDIYNITLISHTFYLTVFF